MCETGDSWINYWFQFSCHLFHMRMSPSRRIFPVVPVAGGFKHHVLQQLWMLLETPWQRLTCFICWFVFAMIVSSSVFSFSKMWIQPTDIQIMTSDSFVVILLLLFKKMIVTLPFCLPSNRGRHRSVFTEAQNNGIFFFRYYIGFLLPWQLSSGWKCKSPDCSIDVTVLSTHLQSRCQGVIEPLNSLWCRVSTVWVFVAPVWLEAPCDRVPVANGCRVCKDVEGRRSRWIQ